jgi:hypothetical protein
MTIYKPIKTTDKIKRKGKIIQSSARAFLEIKNGKKRIISRREYDEKIRKIERKPAPAHIKAQTNRYKALVRDYIAKQEQKKKLGYTLTKREARNSKEFKEVLKKIKRGDKLKEKGKIKEGNKLIVDALKETIRRDNIKDDVEPGQSKGYSGHASNN